MEWNNEHPPYVKGALRSRSGPFGQGQDDGPGMCDGLEAADGEMGVATAAIADFAGFLPEIDLETGCEILRQLAEAVREVGVAAGGRRPGYVEQGYPDRGYIDQAGYPRRRSEQFDGFEDARPGRHRATGPVDESSHSGARTRTPRPGRRGAP